MRISSVLRRRFRLGRAALVPQDPQIRPLDGGFEAPFSVRLCLFGGQERSGTSQTGAVWAGFASEARHGARQATLRRYDES